MALTSPPPLHATLPSSPTSSTPAPPTQPATSSPPQSSPPTPRPPEPSPPPSPSSPPTKAPTSQPAPPAWTTSSSPRTADRSKAPARYQLPAIRPVVYAPASPTKPAADTGLWNQSFELALALDLPRIDDARYRRPYTAVWIEDADHFPVRTLALWTNKPRWLPELKQWYRDDQVRNLSESTDISRTVSSATRPPGSYTLKWDGKDNEGKPVKAGKYTVVVEAAREHGGYQIERQEMTFAAQPQQAELPAGKELGSVKLDYRKR